MRFNVNLFGVIAITPVADESGYVGPLDRVPGAVFAYSVGRAMSSAKRGSPIHTMRRDSDDATSSFNSDAVTGEAPAAAISSFTGDAFIRNGAVVEDSADVVLADAAGVRVNQFVAGTNIQNGSFVTDISNAPTITLNQVATGTNPGVALIFRPRGYIAALSDMSGNSKDMIQETLTAQPALELSEEDVADKPAISFSQDLGTVSLATADEVTFPSGAATIFMLVAGALQIHIRTDSGPNLDFQGGTAAFIDMADADGNEAYNEYGNLLDDKKYRIYVARWDISRNSLRIDGVPIDRTSEFHSGSELGSIAGLMSFIANNGYTALVEAYGYPFFVSDAEVIIEEQDMADLYGITLP